MMLSEMSETATRPVIGDCLTTPCHYTSVALKISDSLINIALSNKSKAGFAADFRMPGTTGSAKASDGQRGLRHRTMARPRVEMRQPR
jgi:hypothetical protein